MYQNLIYQNSELGNERKEFISFDLFLTCLKVCSFF